MLKISGLKKAFTDSSGETKLFDSLDLLMTEGESVAIMGASGSGKSSLLHIIASLLAADSGTLHFSMGNETFAIHDLSEKEANHFRRDMIGIVFQRFNLIDFITVKQNIYLPAIHKGNADENYLNELIERLSIQKLLSKRPPQLSGGEQQRVAVARALAHKPQLLLADEPTGSLDPVTSSKVINLLYDACRNTKTAMLMVTHSEEAASPADRRLVMRNQKLYPQS